MTKKLKVLAIFIISIFWLTMMFVVTNAGAQINSFELDRLYSLAQTNYWYDSLSSTWLVGQYGDMFSQPKDLYSFNSWFWAQSPGVSIASPYTLWTPPALGITQSGFPNYLNTLSIPLNDLSYIQSVYSRVPFGCQPLFEKKTCRSRGGCRIPVYCPISIPNLFGGWDITAMTGNY